MPPPPICLEFACPHLSPLSSSIPTHPCCPHCWPIGSYPWAGDGSCPLTLSMMRCGSGPQFSRYGKWGPSKRTWGPGQIPPHSLTPCLVGEGAGSGQPSWHWAKKLIGSRSPWQPSSLLSEPLWCVLQTGLRTGKVPRFCPLPRTAVFYPAQFWRQRLLPVHCPVLTSWLHASLWGCIEGKAMAVWQAQWRGAGGSGCREHGQHC